jgi:hypothetical protein
VKQERSPSWRSAGFWRVVAAAPRVTCGDLAAERGVSFMAAPRGSVSWGMVWFGKRSGGRNQVDDHASRAGGLNNSRARSLPAMLVGHAASVRSRQRMRWSRSP